MKKSSAVVKNYYVLPCCLLLLNLANSIIGYKAELIDEPILRTFTVILLVLFGSSLVAFVLSPAISTAINAFIRSGRRNAGSLGEILALLALGGLVFFAYYRLCNDGVTSLLPAAWHN